MSTLSSANVTDVNLVLKERTHMRLCLNMLIFTHNLDNWLIRYDHKDRFQNENWNENRPGIVKACCRAVTCRTQLDSLIAVSRRQEVRK